MNPKEHHPENKILFPRRNYHPVLKKYPFRLGKDKREILKSDLKKQGQHETIKLLDNMIIDGRERYELLEELFNETKEGKLDRDPHNFLPSFEHLPEKTDPEEYARSMNVHRKLLPLPQRCYYAVKNWTEEKQISKQQRKKNLRQFASESTNLVPSVLPKKKGKTIKIVAALWECSPNSIIKMDKICQMAGNNNIIKQYLDLLLDPDRGDEIIINFKNKKQKKLSLQSLHEKVKEMKEGRSLNEEKEERSPSNQKFKKNVVKTSARLPDRKEKSMLTLAKVEKPQKIQVSSRTQEKRKRSCTSEAKKEEDQISKEGSLSIPEHQVITSSEIVSISVDFRKVMEKYRKNCKLDCPHIQRFGCNFTYNRCFHLFCIKNVKKTGNITFLSKCPEDCKHYDNST